MHKKGTDSKTSPRPQIVRDTSGYKIEPHPDTRKKAVTMMVYLPRDESQKDLGTSLYKLQPSLQGLTSKRKWFKEVKRFPFTEQRLRVRREQLPAQEELARSRVGRTERSRSREKPQPREATQRLPTKH